jgi:hypothetical protein
VLRTFRENLPENLEIRLINNNGGLQSKDRERRVSKGSGRKILSTLY